MVSPSAVRVWTARVAVAAALAAAVSLAALRVTPQVWGDPGVWLSVAARLLDGDRLYADVFDNKDPFFFYSYALSLRVAGVRGPFALEVVWLAVGTVWLAMALRALRVETLAVVTGAVVYPLALTASWYVPGATMVPALAIAPLALWLWARGAASAAGFLVVVAMLFKLNLGLVVAAPLIALLLVGDAGASRRRRAVDVTCGAADRAHPLRAPAGRARRIAPLPRYDRVQRPLLGRRRARRRPPRAPRDHPRVLRGVGQVATSRRGARDGHVARRLAPGMAARGRRLQACVRRSGSHVGRRFRDPRDDRGVHRPLATPRVPGGPGCATLVLALRELWKPLAVGAAAICIALAVRASLGQEDLSALSVHAWTTAPVSTPGTALEATRARLFPDGRRVSYAVFGRNTEDGHAAFVSRSMDLQCRYFHQYPFYRDAQLQETLDCARR